jgi:hypothetical protein
LKRAGAQLERFRKRESAAWARVDAAQQAAVRVHEDVFALELDAARLRAQSEVNASA